MEPLALSVREDPAHTVGDPVKVMVKQPILARKKSSAPAAVNVVVPNAVGPAMLYPPVTYKFPTASVQTPRPNSAFVPSPCVAHWGVPVELYFAMNTSLILVAVVLGSVIVLNV